MMRPTPKISVFLLVIGIGCMGLMFVFCNSVWTQEAKKANPGIKELQKQRLAVLEEIRDTAKKLFANARTTPEDVHSAERTLLEARVAYAETRKDRIKACDEAVQNANEWHQIVQGRVQASRASGLEELKARAFVLETQIARENAETGE
jgi:hypothetical protein